MITITVKNESDRAPVEKYMERSVRHDPQLNGEEFEIEVGELFSISGIDGIDGAALFSGLSSCVHQWAWRNAE